MSPDTDQTAAGIPGTELRLSPGSSTSTPEQTTTIQRRRPIPRKGHTKSRRGCFNCKRRKVKCQENVPSCTNCTRHGFDCEYPGRPSLSSSSCSPLLARPALQSMGSPTQFTMDDLRFFHHFLITAYPPLPIQGDEIWRDVAALSHSFDYLIHAMLALAASHLTLLNSSCDYSTTALAHRVQAIKSLNRSLSTPCASRSEGDARFAAIMALTFQSSCMPDGMTEFVAMIRGCHVIATTSMPCFEESLFQTFTQEGYANSVRSLLPPEDDVPTSEETGRLIDGFLVSLSRLAPLCESSIELKFLAGTERLARIAKVSPVEGFAQFTTQYALVNTATSEEWARFTDAECYGAQLLLIHFFLIEFAIGDLVLGPSKSPAGPRFHFRRRVCIAWLERLSETLGDGWGEYLEWPAEFAQSLRGAT